MNVFNRLLQKQDDNVHLLIVETIQTLVEEYGDQIMQVSDDQESDLPEIKSRWYTLIRLLVCMVFYRVPKLSENPMAIASSSESSQRPISGKLLMAICDTLSLLVCNAVHAEIIECIVPIVFFTFGATISSEKTSNLVLLEPIKRIADFIHCNRERLKNAHISSAIQSFASSILELLKYGFNIYF
jgi:hypothetical protein